MKVLLHLTLLICPVSLTDSPLKMMNNVIIHEADIKDIGKSVSFTLHRVLTGLRPSRIGFAAKIAEFKGI